MTDVVPKISRPRRSRLFNPYGERKGELVWHAAEMDEDVLAAIIHLKRSRCKAVRVIVAVGLTVLSLSVANSPYEIGTYSLIVELGGYTAAVGAAASVLQMYKEAELATKFMTSIVETRTVEVQGEIISMRTLLDNPNKTKNSRVRNSSTGLQELAE